MDRFGKLQSKRLQGIETIGNYSTYHSFTFYTFLTTLVDGVRAAHQSV
jgi:hypothetical protein